MRGAAAFRGRSGFAAIPDPQRKANRRFSAIHASRPSPGRCTQLKGWSFNFRLAAPLSPGAPARAQRRAWRCTGGCMAGIGVSEAARLVGRDVSNSAPDDEIGAAILHDKFVGATPARSGRARAAVRNRGDAWQRCNAEHGPATGRCNARRGVVARGSAVQGRHACRSTAAPRRQRGRAARGARAADRGADRSAGNSGRHRPAVRGRHGKSHNGAERAGRAGDRDHQKGVHTMDTLGGRFFVSR